MKTTLELHSLQRLLQPFTGELLRDAAFICRMKTRQLRQEWFYLMGLRMFVTASSCISVYYEVTPKHGAS
jgi:predicted nuclease of restriction endonuclease-like (RecB) superfamily